MITPIKTWGQWAIVHDDYADRFEATRDDEGKTIKKHSASLSALQSACDKYDEQEETIQEKFKPVAVYKWDNGYGKFIYGKITSIYFGNWSSTPYARFKKAGQDSWQGESIYSDNFVLQTPENEKKIEEIKTLTEQRKEIDEKIYTIRDSMEYFIPPKK